MHLFFKRSPLSNCELHLFYYDTAYEPVGNSDWFTLKMVPFHVTFFLCCCSKAESMPTGVLVTHIQALAGLARGSSRVLNNKTFVFLYHVFLCKYKRVPLHLSTWLFSPMFPAECRLMVLLSHMELWEVLRCGTKESYNPDWITSCLWSLKWPVGLSLPPLKIQARSVSKEGRKRESIRKRRRADCWVDKSIKGAGKKTDWMCKL